MNKRILKSMTLILFFYPCIAFSSDKIDGALGFKLGAEFDTKLSMSQSDLNEGKIKYLVKDDGQEITSITVTADNRIAEISSFMYQNDMTVCEKNRSETVVNYLKETYGLGSESEGQYTIKEGSKRIYATCKESEYKDGFGIAAIFLDQDLLNSK